MSMSMPVWQLQPEYTPQHYRHHKGTVSCSTFQSEACTAQPCKEKRPGGRRSLTLTCSGRLQNIRRSIKALKAGERHHREAV